nr:putative PEP-binding protein [Rhodospirillum rubrum]
MRPPGERIARGRLSYPGCGPAPGPGGSRIRTLKLGICGEHGGDPQSISFCQSVGLDYVSCSPYRVPIARLAAAQAALRSVVKQPAMV